VKKKVKKLPDNALPDEHYSLKGLGSLGLAIPALILAGFVFNFPLGRVIENTAGRLLQANRSCQISHQGIEATYFPPGIRLKKPIVPGSCFGGQQALTLDIAKVNIAIPGLFPPGLKLHATATGMDSQFDIYPLLTFGSTKIRIEESVVDSKLINSFIPGNPAFTGKLQIEALAVLEGNKISEIDFNISSKDLSTLPLNIMGFQIPALALNKLSAIGTYNKSNLITVNKLELGDDKAALAALFKGSVKLSPGNMLGTNLDLDGQIKFSPDFLEAFPILTPMWKLDQRPRHEGYYRLRLKGGVMALQNPEFL
jgi:hypothetical protein